MKAKFLCLFLFITLLSGCWQKMMLYSIRLQGSGWEKLDIRKPLAVDHDYSSSKYEVKIPHQYNLERESYRIEVKVNPSDHGWQTSLQILAINQSNEKVLTMKSSWGGNCGITGKTSKTGKWNNHSDKFKSIGYPFFTDPRAIGFLWYPGTGYCTEGIPETSEHASSFPIMLEIFDNSNLIGKEQIDFEIFENGIMKYIVMP